MPSIYRRFAERHNAGVENADTIVLRLAYLGGGFAGWQRQRRARTVQSEVERALEHLYGAAVRVRAAGRTDAGVHASGQVAQFRAPSPIPPDGVLAALNSLLPHDVRVVHAARASAAFDVRRDAIGKLYRYRLAWGIPLPPWDGLRTWVLRTTPDVDAMVWGLTLFEGCHDFAAFALAGHAGTGARGTVRSIAHACARRRGRHLVVDLIGDGFLRGMARRIVGALVEVGRGARPISWVEALLADSATKPPAPTAPAHGLTLERVLYRRPPRQRG